MTIKLAETIGTNDWRNSVPPCYPRLGSRVQYRCVRETTKPQPLATAGASDHEGTYVEAHPYD